MRTPVTDRTELDAPPARAVRDPSAGYGGVTAGLGYKPGIHRAMAGGDVGHHAVSDPYALSPEQAMLRRSRGRTTPPGELADGRSAALAAGRPRPALR